MRVLIAGAGSLGTVYGGFLARAGCDVQMLTRPAHAAAIEANGGVEVRSVGSVFTAALRATAAPSGIEPVEVVILLCKAQDTEQLLSGLGHLAADTRLAVSLQNGMVGAQALTEWCDPAVVIGGVSMVGATLLEPGVAAHTLPGPTFLGPRSDTPAVTRELLLTLAEALRTGGLDVEQTDRIGSVEWSKLVHASPSMALTALTRLDFHQVFLLPELAELFLDLVSEGVAIARAAGIEVDDWPHVLPVRSIASLPRDQALSEVRAFGTRMVDAGMTDVRISMLQSVERGRSTEVDAIHGHLVRTANSTGVAAPVTRTVHQLLAGLDRTLS